MNPEAEKLQGAMRRCGPGIGHGDARMWLRDNADTVAELVDAALDLAAYGPSRASRLYRAADAFKGPQGPPEPRREHVPTLGWPEPQRESIEMLLCPEDGCKWARYTHSREASDAMEHYRRHYHTDHGGRP